MLFALAATFLSTFPEPPFVVSVSNVLAPNALVLSIDANSHTVLLDGIGVSELTANNLKESTDFVRGYVTANEMSVTSYRESLGLILIILEDEQGNSFNELLLTRGLANFDRITGRGNANYEELEAMAKEEQVGHWRRGGPIEVISELNKDEFADSEHIPLDPKYRRAILSQIEFAAGYEAWRSTNNNYRVALRDQLFNEVVGRIQSYTSRIQALQSGVSSTRAAIGQINQNVADVERSANEVLNEVYDDFDVEWYGGMLDRYEGSLVGDLVVGNEFGAKISRRGVAKYSYLYNTSVNRMEGRAAQVLGETSRIRAQYNQTLKRLGTSQVLGEHLIGTLANNTNRIANRELLRLEKLARYDAMIVSEIRPWLKSRPVVRSDDGASQKKFSFSLRSDFGLVTWKSEPTADGRDFEAWLKKTDTSAPYAAKLQYSKYPHDNLLPIAGPGYFEISVRESRGVPYELVVHEVLD